MTGWTLIGYVLDEAVCNAETLLERRRKDFAGYRELGRIGDYEAAVAEAKYAREEFAALKQGIKDAPRYNAEVRSYDDYDAIELTHDDPAHKFPDVSGKRAALVVLENGE